MNSPVMDGLKNDLDPDPPLVACVGEQGWLIFRAFHEHSSYHRSGRPEIGNATVEHEISYASFFLTGVEFHCISRRVPMLTCHRSLESSRCSTAQTTWIMPAILLRLLRSQLVHFVCFCRVLCASPWGESSANASMGVQLPPGRGTSGPEATTTAGNSSSISRARRCPDRPRKAAREERGTTRTTAIQRLDARVQVVQVVVTACGMCHMPCDMQRTR